MFSKLWEDLGDVDLQLEDILKLSVSQSESQKSKFPISIYFSKSSSLIKPLQVKRALLAALMYPLELIDPNSNSIDAQNYKNVPIQ